MIFFDKDFINDTKYKINYDALVSSPATDYADYGLHIQTGKAVNLWKDSSYSSADPVVCILKCDDDSQSTFWLDDSILAKEIAPNTWKLVLKKTAI